MKQRKTRTAAAGGAANRLPTLAASRESLHPDKTVIVVRTEKRSWFALAITGFGALLLRYFKTVRQRARTARG